MSVVSLSDILFSDLLKETGMKPWWEKVRGYILSSSVAFALSATYLTLHGIRVNCLPLVNGNISFIGNIDNAQAAWTNTYCSNSIPWYTRFSGGMSLLAAIAMVAASSYWLHMPKVIDSFVSFAEMVKIISDCHMAFDDLCRMSFQPLKRGDIDTRQLKLRQVCQEILKEHQAHFELEGIYRHRNYLLLGVSVIVAIGSGLKHALWLSLGDEFHCNITTNNLYMLQGKQPFPRSVVCVSSIAHQLIVLNLLFTLSVVIQIVPIAYGVVKCGWWLWNGCVIQQRHLNNIDFLSFFWRCGQPKWSEAFSKLVDYVRGHEAHDDIVNSLKEAILLEDDYIINSFFWTKYDLPQHPLSASELIIQKMYELYQSALNDNTGKGIDDIESKIAAGIDKYIPADTVESKYFKFLNQVLFRNTWRLIAGVVNQYVGKLITTGDDPTVKGFNLLQKLKINYDILDEHGCSIMYYFLAMSNMRTISQLLSKQYKETREYELYEHYDGKSVLVSGRTDVKIEHTKALDGANYMDGQQRIKHYHDTFLYILRGEASMDLDFINGLSRIKFREWDDYTKDFAIKAYEKKDWCTFITLLNCYIIPDENEVGYFPLACGVTKGIGTDALRQALSYPIPFVGTAAKHIIACFTSDQRYVAGAIIKDSELRNDYRKMLQQFISDYDSSSEKQSYFVNSTESLGYGSNQSSSATSKRRSKVENSNYSFSDSRSFHAIMESASDTDSLIQGRSTHNGFRS